MRLQGHPAFAGRSIRLTALSAALDKFPTPATYTVTADSKGDFDTGAHDPRPGPYEVAVHTDHGWLSPGDVFGDKRLNQYVVGGWPGLAK
jgi:hypothetical protein